MASEQQPGVEQQLAPPGLPTDHNVGQDSGGFAQQLLGAKPELSENLLPVDSTEDKAEEASSDSDYDPRQEFGEGDQQEDNKDDIVAKPPDGDSSETPEKKRKWPKKPAKPRDRPYDKVCDQCGKAYQDTSKLNRHKNEVHLRRRFYCQHCPRDFRTNREVKQHVARDHLGRMDYLCDYCSKPFADKSAMNRHVRNMHAENKEVTTNCCNIIKSCNFDFLSSSNVRPVAKSLDSNPITQTMS